MKLRNKKTGEIIEDAQYRNYSTADGFGIQTPTEEYFYKSLKEFFEDWEDYTYQEPLIKAEKIRKAVRAWAEANDIKEAYYWMPAEQFKSIDGKAIIGFKPLLDLDLDRFPSCMVLPITELCGEEE